VQTEVEMRKESGIKCGDGDSSCQVDEQLVDVQIDSGLSIPHVFAVFRPARLSRETEHVDLKFPMGENTKSYSRSKGSSSHLSHSASI
jgi:hypothetical protein